MIRRSDPVAPSTGDWRALYIGSLANFPGSFKYKTVQIAPDRLFVLGDGVLAAAFEGTQLAAVRGNLMAGGSAPSFSPTGPSVELNVTGSCILTDNQCILLVPGSGVLARLSTPLVSAANNVLTGGTVSLQIEPPGNKFTVLGNIASGKILVNGGQPLAPPWEPLNVHG